MQWILLIGAAILLVTSSVSVEAVEPNFEDIESALEEPQNEVVSIDQENPHSNNIHIAHNIPTGSDITVTQKAPYNATVHISLNIAKECKVKVSVTQCWNFLVFLPFRFYVKSMFMNCAILHRVQCG